MRRRSIVLASALAVATTAASIGLARAAPRPMSRQEIARIDPPADDMVAAVVPRPIKRALARISEANRRRRMSAAEAAIIEAAKVKRLRRNARRLQYLAAS